MNGIRIFVTGGTFDKEYDELHGRLFFKDTHIGEMLRLGRSRVDVSVRTLMMIDSLEMSDADRELIVSNCRHCAEPQQLDRNALDDGISIRPASNPTAPRQRSK